MLILTNFIREIIKLKGEKNIINKNIISSTLIIVSILLATFTGCKKVDVLNINLQLVKEIRIVDGNNGNQVNASKGTNTELFDYIINHFKNARYEKINKHDDYGGYRYALWLTGESEHSIIILSSVQIDFDGNMYILDKSIDIEKLEKFFMN